MVRKLKHHESRLLRKVDFLTYPKSSSDAPQRHAVLRRYVITNADDYTSYNVLCGRIRQLAHRLTLLAPDDPFRLRHEQLLLQKLYEMGLLRNAATAAKLSDVERKITVSAMARRRLAVVMTRLHMCELVSVAVRLVEQGHVRVGTEVVTDPAYLVTRSLEDFVTWVDSSKIKRHILRYRDKVDDFDLDG